MDIEKLRLLYDHTKHVTILSTGAILMLVTFYEKLPGFPAMNVPMSFSLASFSVSILSATFAQIVVISSHSNDDKEYEKNTLKYIDKVFFSSWITFVLGMVILCVMGIFGLFLDA